MRYDNILVEIELKNLQFKNPVQLTMNFKDVIGSAILTRKGDGIYAEIFSEKDLKGFCPALGFTYNNGDMSHGVINFVSMCAENQDSKIKPI